MEVANTKDSRCNLNHVIIELFRYRKGLLLGFFLTTVVRAALSLGAILLIKEFLSGILGDSGGFAGLVAEVVGRQAALWIVAALLTASYVGGSLLGYANVVIRHLLGLSVPFFNKQSEGDIIQAVRQDVSSLRTVVMSMAGLFMNACLAQSYKVRRTGYVLFDVILQILRGIRIIKAFRGEEEEARTAVAKGRAYFDELISIVRVQALAQALLESLASLGIVVVILVGGLEVMRVNLEWRSLLAFLMAARALRGPLNAINGTIINIQNYGASVARIGELLDARPDVPDLPDAAPLESGPQRIEFANVCFAYQSVGLETVLRNCMNALVISLDIFVFCGSFSRNQRSLTRLMQRTPVRCVRYRCFCSCRRLLHTPHPPQPLEVVR